MRLFCPERLLPPELVTQVLVIRYTYHKLDRSGRQKCQLIFRFPCAVGLWLEAKATTTVSSIRIATRTVYPKGDVLNPSAIIVGPLSRSLIGRLNEAQDRCSKAFPAVSRLA